jgi:hypothetical protein
MSVYLIDALNIRERIALNYGNDNNFLEMLLAAKITEFAESMDRLPSWYDLSQAENAYNPKELFIALTDRITEKVSGVQRKLCRFKNLKKKNLETKINTLSSEYKINENEICKAENELRKIKDFELRHMMSEKKSLKI